MSTAEAPPPNLSEASSSRLMPMPPVKFFDVVLHKWGHCFVRHYRQHGFQSSDMPELRYGCRIQDALESSVDRWQELCVHRGVREADAASFFRYCVKIGGIRLWLLPGLAGCIFFGCYSLLEPLCVRLILSAYSSTSTVNSGQDFFAMSGFFFFRLMSVCAQEYECNEGYLLGAKLQNYLAALLWNKFKNIEAETKTLNLLAFMDPLLSVTGDIHCILFLGRAIGIYIGGLVLVFSASGILGVFPFTCVLLLVLAKSFVMKRIQKSIKSDATFRARRVKAMQVLIENIQAAKAFVWEDMLANVAVDYREQELALMWRKMLLMTTIDIINQSIAPIALVVLVVSYAVRDLQPDPAAIFSTYLSLNIVSSAQYTVDKPWATLVKWKIEFTRWAEWLRLPECTTSTDTYESKHSRDTVGVVAEAHDLRVVLQGSKSEAFTLSVSELEISKGCMVAVVGKVGSGKSTLLHVLVRSIPSAANLSGSVQIACQIGFAPQVAYTLSGSCLQENIFLGRERNNHALVDCLAAADFLIDLQGFENGIFQEIGERGCTLSVGQQTRLNLARAAYKNPSLLVLDDPLASVNPSVGHELLQFLRQYASSNDDGRAVICSVNQLDLLGAFDSIIFLVDGELKGQGSVCELLKDHKEFRDLMQGVQLRVFDSSWVADATTRFANKSADMGNLITSSIDQVNGEASQSADFRRPPPSGLHLRGGLWSRYMRTWGWYLPFVIGSGLATSGLQVWTMRYLAVWMDSEAIDHSFSWMHMSYFLAFTSLGLASTMLYGILVAMACYRAARIIHHNCLRKLIHASMEFFDSESAGNLLERFGPSIDALDQGFITVVKTFLSVVFGTVQFMVVLGITLPPIIGLVPIVLFGFFRCIRPLVSFMQQMQQFRKLEISRHILGNVGEFERGRAVAVAMGLQSFFQDRFMYRIGLSTTFELFNLGVRMTMWHAVFLLSGAFVLLVMICLNLNLCGLQASVGLAGMAMVYGNNFTSCLSQLYAFLDQALTYGLALERLMELSDLPQEPPPWQPTDPMSFVEQVSRLSTEITLSPRPSAVAATQDSPPMATATPAQASHQRDPFVPLLDSGKAHQVSLPRSHDGVWPSQGEIEFKDVCFKYKPHYPLVLKNLSLHVEGGTKVGLVGRTGSGKSSAISLLLRLRDPWCGSIRVDGLEIATLGIKFVRANVGLIPQEPVILYGSVKYNLDPGCHYDDTEVWNALRRVGLFGLELGTDLCSRPLSQGEKQLLSFGRVLLWKQRIVTMDEPTACMDLQSDRCIQRLVRSELRDSTVLCIAHRLETILDYDHVFVLDGGRLVEHGRPCDLLKKDSHFASLCCRK